MGIIIKDTINASISGNAATATKATQDGSGRTITTTYSTTGHTHGYSASGHTHGTITLSGDVTGSASIGSGTTAINITTTVANNSHTHTSSNISDSISASSGITSGATGLVQGKAVQAYAATKGHTHGTLTLSGDVTGTATIASGGTTITTTVADDSHNHTKLGTATKGSATQPIYLNSGTPTACTSIDNSLISKSGGTSALAWNTEVTLATIAGQAIKAKLPANPDTNSDTKVTQTVTTTNASYPLLLAPSGQTATTTTTSYFDSGVTLNPSTNILNGAKVYESLLQWGGQSIAGGLSPIDTSMDGQWSANRLSFQPVTNTTTPSKSGVIVEYSTNGGTSWTDYGLTDAQKTSLITTGLSSDIRPGKLSTGQVITSGSTGSQVRVTISAFDFYFSLKKIYIYLSVNGASNMQVKIEASKCGSDTTYTTVGTYKVDGWSGWNSIPCVRSFGGGETQTSNTRRIRMTFFISAISSGYESKTSATINKIAMVGETMWANSGGNLPLTGHLYNWDASKNATFPANVTATKFIGALQGNATSATSATTAGTATKATQDGSGRTITSTYLPLSGGTMTSHIMLTTGTASLRTNDNLVLLAATSSSDYSGVTNGTTTTVLGNGSYPLLLRSTDSDIQHFRGTTSYPILDSKNYTSYAAPKAHASSANTYGLGTTANYGHVKISNGDVNSVAAADGLVAGMDHSHGNYSLTGHTHSAYSGTGHTHNAATTSAAGFMSAADKTKLDDIATGANKYTLPNAGSASKPIYITGNTPTQCTSIDNSLISKSDGTNALAWDTDVTLATIAGVTINAKLPANPIIKKAITTGFTDAFRTQAFGSTGSTNGSISVIRCDTAGVDKAPQYGTGLAIAKGDTHTYLYADYASGLAYMGAGNQDKLNWIKRVQFTDGTAASGTWSISVTGNAATATKATQDGSGRTITSTYALAGHTHSYADVAFKTIDCPRGSDPVADAVGDTLVLADDGYITVTGDSTNDKITFAHATPTANTGSTLTATASGATAAWGLDVVKSVSLQRDAKGHVTGVSVTSGKIPNITTASTTSYGTVKLQSGELSGVTSHADTIAASYFHTHGQYAPKQHASTGTTYGLGSTSGTHGHVQLITGDLNGKTAKNGEAAAAAHTHGQYAPKSHASSATTYGLGATGSTPTYGHVSLITGDLNGKTYANGIAAAAAHTHSQYALQSDMQTNEKVIASALNDLDTRLLNINRNAITSKDGITASATDLVEGKAVYEYAAIKSHATSTNIYGLGTTAQYGHVKISNGDVSTSAAANGIVAGMDHYHSKTKISTTATNSYMPMLFVNATAAGDTTIYIDSSTGTGETSSGIRYNPSGNTCYCSGGFFEASDERLKNFGDNIEVDLDKLAQLPKKYFTWKHDKDGKVHIGTSAQELQKIYPELVDTLEDGTLIVSYDTLSVIALKGVDTLYEKYKSLEERLNKLEKMLEYGNNN